MYRADFWAMGQYAGFGNPEATNLLRPDVGTQPYFPKSKRKPPTRYRYDASLSPELPWDGGNAARELGEWLIGLIADPKGFENPSGLSITRSGWLSRRRS